jgi:hypothetical protein
MNGKLESEITSELRRRAASSQSIGHRLGAGSFGERQRARLELQGRLVVARLRVARLEAEVQWHEGLNRAMKDRLMEKGMNLGDEESIRARTVSVRAEKERREGERREARARVREELGKRLEEVRRRKYSHLVEIYEYLMISRIYRHLEPYRNIGALSSKFYIEQDNYESYSILDLEPAPIEAVDDKLEFPVSAPHRSEMGRVLSEGRAAAGVGEGRGAAVGGRVALLLGGEPDAGCGGPDERIRG